MAAKTYSLRGRLILLISIPILIAGVAIGGIAFYSSWHEIEEVYDAQLVHSAKVLHQFIRQFEDHSGPRVDLIPETQDWGYKYEKNIAFRIWRNQELITRTRNDKEFDAVIALPGLSDQVIDGEKWRFFVYIDPESNVTVETSERYAIRYELIEHLVLGLLLPAGLFVPVVLLLVWYGTSKSLRPLRQLSADVDQRHAEDTRSIETDGIPDEAQPLISALNRLLERLGDSIRREREFTDNAAHELRTPLAAMKTQAQVLQMKLESSPEYSDGLKNLLLSIDRATHMVEQLLAFARLQKQDSPIEEVDLSQLVQEVIRDMAPAATKKNHQLVLDCTDNIAINGNREALAIVIRNLVDNAIKYTPHNGEIRVCLNESGRSVVLTVSDNGPGVPDAVKQRVFERFFRGDNGQIVGSGLGLSIVKWVADQYAASLELSNAQPSGLRCTLRFVR